MWRPRLRPALAKAGACTRSLGRIGTPPARHYDLAARSSLHCPAGSQPPESRSADPVTVNRHGRAPRGARPLAGDARRLASASACRVMVRQGCLASTPRRLGAPSPSFGEGKSMPREGAGDTRRPRANEQRAAKLWLFDIVRREQGDRELLPQAPLARAATRQASAGGSSTAGPAFGTKPNVLGYIAG